MHTRFIDQPEQLQHFCEQARTSPFLSVDTEFRRRETYWPKLCLVQIATDSMVALIDPLSLPDLSPLKKLLVAPQKLKILHAGRQDLEIFFRLWQVIPSPIMDTQILASVCGFGDSCSYEELLSSLLGQKINKSCQVTNWQKRPLSPQQKNYAAQDVFFLNPLYSSLCTLAGEKKQWIQEKLDALSSPETYQKKEDLLHPHTLSIQDFPPHSFAHPTENLRLFKQWREQIARKTDCPQKKILSDDQLKKIASQKNLTLSLLHQNLPAPLHPFLPLLFFLFSENLQHKQLHPRKALSPQQSDFVPTLAKLRDEVAASEKISPTLLAKMEDLKTFVCTPDTHFLTQGWRHKIFGEKALKLLKRTCTVDKKREKIHASHSQFT